MNAAQSRGQAMSSAGTPGGAPPLAAIPPLRGVAITAVLILVFGLGGSVAWAALTVLERAVIAAGSVIPEGRRKSVTLLEPGLLRELVVREGQQVQAGAVLIRLDVTQAESVANQARASFWSGSARLARLQAEQRGSRAYAPPAELDGELVSDPALSAIVEAERQLLAARWAAFDGAVAVQQRRIAQLQEQISAIQAQRAAASTRLAALREELDGVQQLLRSGFATRTRALELRRSEAEMLGNVGQFTSQEAAARQAISQAELELANLELNRRTEIARELQDTQALVLDATQRLRSALDLLQRREVTAPEDGTVTDIRFVTPGSSIPAGQPILDIVPADDRLIIEVQLAVNDIEQVQPGQRANVRLAAFRMQQAPLLAARVTYVSADRITDTRGNSFYVARLALDDPVAVEAAGLSLFVGMPVEAFILGEQRTVLAYLVAPVRDSLRRSLRD